MSKNVKRYVKKDAIAQPVDTGNLPTDKPIAIYLRQSSKGQIGNVSTDMQAIDLPNYVEKRGWHRKDHCVIKDDFEGVSGTLSIEERPGMKRMCNMIRERKIGAVAVQAEDRLFRDETRIQVDTFIEICKQSGVIVIVVAEDENDDTIYAFHDRRHGKADIRQFREKTEAASDYLQPGGLHDRMLKGRDREQREGKWAGGSITPGYMVKTVKTERVVNGKNKTEKRYVPFGPHAEVIREYFRIVVQYKGNMHAAEKHIELYGPYIPNYEECRIPQDCIVKMHKSMKLRDNGRYYPSADTLRYICQNAMYLGHWLVKGQIVKYNNHEGIVPLELFMAAFNYLSPVCFDGSPNENYAPRITYRKPKEEAERGVERPLYCGFIQSQDKSGQWRQVGVAWEVTHYKYVHWNSTKNAVKHQVQEKRWQREADFIDPKITELLRDKLFSKSATDVFGDEDIKKAQAELEEEKRQIAQKIKTQADLEKRAFNNMAYADDPADLPKFKALVEGHRDEQCKLTEKLINLENQAAQQQRLLAVKDEVGYYADNWERLTTAQMRVAIEYFIDCIQATPVEDELLLVVHWRDHSTSEIDIAFRRDGWLKADTARLLGMVDNAATQLEILKAYPARTWSQIRSKYQRESNIWLIPKPCEAHDNETYGRYLSRTDTKAYWRYMGRAVANSWQPDSYDDSDDALSEDL